MKIALVTDSSSGITLEEIKGTSIHILPIPIIVNDTEYLEGKNLTRETFFNLLKEDNNISTSQPSIYTTEKLWSKLLENYEHIIHIPISSALSASYDTASHLANEKYAGKVTVIDNKRVSTPLKSIVFSANKMIDKNKPISKIISAIYKNNCKSTIFITMNTIKYLKKGGRITPTAAAIGTLLNIKPILILKDGKLDAYKKAMSYKMAISTIINAVDYTINNEFAKEKKSKHLKISIMYTTDEEYPAILRDELKSKYPDVEFEFLDPLTLVISAHIGPGAIAVAIYSN